MRRPSSGGNKTHQANPATAAAHGRVVLSQEMRDDLAFTLRPHRYRRAFADDVQLIVNLYRHDVARYRDYDVRTPAHNVRLRRLARHGAGLLAELDAEPAMNDYDVRFVLYPVLDDAVALWRRLVEVSKRPKHRPTNAAIYVFSVRMAALVIAYGVPPTVKTTAPFVAILHLTHEWAARATAQKRPAEKNKYRFAKAALARYRAGGNRWALIGGGKPMGA